jgi:hypothetical protein
MRYVWGLLGSLLICSPAQAAPVQFSITGIFHPIDNPIELTASGFQPDIGNLVFDRDASLGAGDRFSVGLEELQEFDLMVPLVNPRTGESQGSFAFAIGGFSPFRCVGDQACGLTFQGNSFTGFQGTIGAGGRIIGDSPLLTLNGFGGLTLDTGLDAIASGVLAFEYEGVVSPVPEPSSWAILGIGALAAGWAYRKRPVTRSSSHP